VTEHAGPSAGGAPEGLPEAVNPEHIMQVGMGFWASRTLLSAVELGLFTALAVHPDDADQVRVRLGLHPRATRDFLDALVALGFLQRMDGVYSNTPETDVFLDRHKPSYIGGMLEMASHRLYPAWAGLTEGLRTGQPQNELQGGEMSFAELYSDPERLQSFLSAMTGVSHGANMAIAAKFPWQTYTSFVDAGTAQGDLAVQVARAHPHLTGIGFDFAVVEPVFEEYVAKSGVADRVKFVPGDFFEQPLPKTDVVMMGHVLHGVDLEQKKRLVRRAFDALPDGGAFIVYESIIDDDRRANAMGLLMSLNMLIETKGEFDYTAADCIGWMTDAGFKDTYAEHLVGPDSMVVGVK
jgi:hypothetical protein